MPVETDLRILVLGDIHGRLGLSRSRIIEKVDAILVAGDFTNASNDSFAEEVINFLASISENIFAVPGNMDRKGVIDILERKKACVHMVSKKFNEYRVFGFGGSNPTPFRTPFEIEETDIEKEVFQVKNIDIAVFHAPPYGYFDWINGYNVGSKAILKWIEASQPSIAVCAHIHEHQGVAKIGNTLLVKVGMACKGDSAIIEKKGDDFLVRFLRD